jgi:peptidoglycan DL-endopeptidase CwlO
VMADSAGSTFGFGSMAATRAVHLAGSAVAIVADPGAVPPGPDLPAGPGARMSAAASASEPGAQAVRFALAQVGKPYLWGGTGPDAYDCSGLALASWRAAGVGLPRTAAEQYYAGAHVPLSQLRPGDLVFWASDPADPATIYHVALSLGGQETVQATHSGSTVLVMPLSQPGLVPLATEP